MKFWDDMQEGVPSEDKILMVGNPDNGMPEYIDLGVLALSGSSTKTIQDLVGGKVNSSDLFDKHPLHKATTTGAIIKATGKAIGIGAATDYKRTSVTTADAMYPIEEGKKYYYSGVINNSEYCGVAYYTDNLEFVGYECDNVTTYDSYQLTAPLTAKLIGTCSYGGEPEIGNLTSRFDSKIDSNTLENNLGLDGNKIASQQSTTEGINLSINAALIGKNENVVNIGSSTTETITQPLLLNETYIFSAKILSGKPILTLYGVKEDNSTIQLPISLIYGRDVYFTNTLADFVSVNIYFGSASEVGQILFNVSSANRTFNQELFSSVENIFPNPFFIKSSFNDKGFVNEISNGTYSIENGKFKIPKGVYVFLHYRISELGLSLSDVLNIVCKTNNIAESKVQIGFDTDTSGTYKFIEQVVYSDYSQANILSSCPMAVTKSGNIQIRFDNRDGQEDMIISSFIFWKGKSSNGVLLNELIETRKAVASIKQPYENSLPNYTSWNNEGGYLKLEKKATSFLMEFDKNGVALFGHELDIEYKKELFITIKDYKCTTPRVDLIVIFKDEIGTQLSRVNNSLTGKEYSSKTFKYTPPQNTAKVLLRYQSTVLASDNETHTMTCGKTYLSDTDIPENIFDVSGANDVQVKQSRLFVSSQGDDKNEGSMSLPFKTISAAQNAAGDVADIYIIGDYETNETIDIKRNPLTRELRITGETDKTAMIIGDKITSGGFVDGLPNVYVVDIPKFDSKELFLLFQKDVADISTKIIETRRHPLHKGREYRCIHSQMMRTNSIDDVKANEHRYYYDATSKHLYFSVKAGTNLTDNPIIIPTSDGIYNNNKTIKVELNNIDFLGRGVNLKKSPNVKMTDCVIFGSSKGAGISLNNSVGATLVRCEVGRTFSGTTSGGDGINIHSDYPNRKTAKCSTATLIDCYSHDNNDDGYSDHENCEVTIIGGLYECNRKGGLTPAYGAHDTYYNVTVQDNAQYGIGMVGGAAIEEGGIGGQTIAHACLSRYNKVNYYVSGAGGIGGHPNWLTLIKCSSHLATESGYSAQVDGILDAYECTDLGSPQAKQEVSNGVVNVYNGVMI